MLSVLSFGAQIKIRAKVDDYCAGNISAARSISPLATALKVSC